MKKTSVIAFALALLLCAAVLSGCRKGGEDLPRVVIEMEGGGVIELELDRKTAPVTVDNFLKLVGDGFYNGLTFHRIIPGFMIQGGDPEGTGRGGSKDKIVGEFSDNGHKNDISHVRGVISMARVGGDMNSASCQFFITNADATQLDGSYAAFGHVVSGMDEVDRISAVKTGANDAPREPVVIKAISQVRDEL